MDPFPRFTERLKQALWEERINARQLALKIGVNPSYITRMLAGERNPPTDELIIKIADALKLDRDLLLIEAGRLPQFLTGSLSAMGPITEEDVKVLKRATDRIRLRHMEEQGKAKK